MIAPNWLDVVERSKLLLAPSLIQTQRAPCLVHSVCSSASKFALRQELGRRRILGRGPVSAHKVAVSEGLEVSPLLVLGGGNVVSILCASPIFGCFLHPVCDLTAHALNILPIIRLVSARPILAFNTRDLRSQHLNLAVALLFLELIDIFEGSFWRLRY